jgi:hypothetical protein
MREILNYLRIANHGFAWVHEGRPITTALLCDLNALLMTGMPLASVSGRLRDKQIVIARRAPTPTGPASRSTPRASCLRPRAPRWR